MLFHNSEALNIFPFGCQRDATLEKMCSCYKQKWTTSFSHVQFCSLTMRGWTLTHDVIPSCPAVCSCTNKHVVCVSLQITGLRSKSKLKKKGGGIQIFLQRVCFHATSVERNKLKLQNCSVVRRTEMGHKWMSSLCGTNRLFFLSCTRDERFCGGHVLRNQAQKQRSPSDTMEPHQPAMMTTP